MSYHRAVGGVLVVADPVEVVVYVVGGNFGCTWGNKQVACPHQNRNLHEAEPMASQTGPVRDILDEVEDQVRRDCSDHVD